MQAGGLLALWVADQAGSEVVLEDGALRGGKMLCSGADAVAAAVVTARTPLGEVLAWLPLRDGRRFEPAAPWPLAGMQATRSVGLSTDGLRVDERHVMGPPGAYRREPHYSGGMWRILALQLGTLERLSDLLAERLRRTGREHAPAQRLRLLENAMDCETVSHWGGEGRLDGGDGRRYCPGRGLWGPGP